MSDNSYSQLPYRTPGCVLPSPLALRGGCYLLFGIESRSPQFRCLDIGCGTGCSLLRLAKDFPEQVFTGIDLSEEQIRIANRDAQEKGLKNAVFRCENFLDLPTDTQFDVVYCYGVLSYCPPGLWNPLLQKIQDMLKPNGAALVSYNVYPGWHFKGMLRDIMKTESNCTLPPSSQVISAKAFTKFFIQGLPSNSLHRQLIQQLYQDIECLDDTYLFHEYLEEENHAYHFRDFVRMSADAGLRYISEFPFAQSRISELSVENHFLPYLRKCLSQDRMKMEEFIDIAIRRSFRRSILCRNDLALGEEDAARWRNCRFRLGPLSFAVRQTVRDILPNATLQVAAPYGGKKTLEAPNEIAALFLLREEMDYERLWNETQKTPAIEMSGGITEQKFLQGLMKLLLHGFIVPIPPFPLNSSSIQTDTFE